MKVRESIALLMSFIVLIFSCTSKHTQPSLDTMVNDFAQLECRAISLREQRFALANQIRFTQDTLVQFNDKADTARLKAMLNILNTKKEYTTKQSLLLADSIKYTLDSLMSHYLTTKEDKDKFNQLLNNTLANMHCKDSSLAAKY
jgi:hypothetical protein